MFKFWFKDKSSSVKIKHNGKYVTYRLQPGEALVFDGLDTCNMDYSNSYGASKDKHHSGCVCLKCAAKVGLAPHQGHSSYLDAWSNLKSVTPEQLIEMNKQQRKGDDMEKEQARVETDKSHSLQMGRGRAVYGIKIDYTNNYYYFDWIDIKGIKQQQRQYFTPPKPTFERGRIGHAWNNGHKDQKWLVHYKYFKDGKHLCCSKHRCIEMDTVGTHCYYDNFEPLDNGADRVRELEDCIREVGKILNSAGNGTAADHATIIVKAMFRINKVQE
jgi:hypothetical protein